MKNILTSKTFRVNVLVALVSILGLLSGSPLLAQYSEWLALAAAVVNIILRTMTTQGVYMPGTPMARIYDRKDGQE